MHVEVEYVKEYVEFKEHIEVEVNDEERVVS